MSTQSDTDAHLGTDATHATLSGQRDIYLAMQMAADPTLYNTGAYTEISADIDVDVLRAAVRHALTAATALRAVFIEEAGELRQQVLPVDAFEIPVVDLTDGDPQAHMAADLAVPMDISAGPLARISVLRVSPEMLYLYFAVHHLVCDGAGVMLFMRAVKEFYESALLGEPSSAIAHTWDLDAVQDAQDTYLSGKFHALDRKYWLKRMADRPAPVRLLDTDLPPGKGVPHARFEITADRLAPLYRAAAQVGVSAPVALIAAVACFARIRGTDDDLVIAVPVTGRVDPALRTTPAMLTSVLPLRVTASPLDRFADIVARTDRAMLRLMAHSRFRPEELGRELARDGGPYRMFGLGCNVLSDATDQTLDGHPTRAHVLASGPVSDVEIQIQMRGGDQPAEVIVRGVADAAAQATTIAGAFDDFLRVLATTPDARLQALSAHDDQNTAPDPAAETYGSLPLPPALHRLRASGIDPDGLAPHRITASVAPGTDIGIVAATVTRVLNAHSATRATLARPLPILWTLTTTPPADDDIPVTAVDSITDGTDDTDDTSTADTSDAHTSDATDASGVTYAAATGEITVVLDAALVDPRSARIIADDLALAFDDVAVGRTVIVEPPARHLAGVIAEITAAAADPTTLPAWLRILAPTEALPAPTPSDADTDADTDVAVTEPLDARADDPDTDTLLAAVRAAIATTYGDDAPSEIVIDVVTDLRSAVAGDAGRTVGPLQALTPHRTGMASPAGPPLDALRHLSPQVSGALTAAAAAGDIAQPPILLGDYGLPTDHPVRIRIIGTAAQRSVDVRVDATRVDAAHRLATGIATAVVDAADPRLVTLDDDTAADLTRRLGPIEDIWPLTPLQEGLYYQAQVDAGADIYTAQFWLDVGHHLDVAALRAAARQLLDENPELRAAFVDVDGRPLQIIRAGVAPEITVCDLTDLPTADAAARVEEILVADRALPFDLARAPLWRMILLRLPDGGDRLVVNRRFLLWDGWSGGLFVSRLLAHLHGTPVPPREASLRDYLAWIDAGDPDAARIAWQEHLAGYEEPSLIAPRAVGVAPRAPHRIEVGLGAELSARLRADARSAGVTLNAVMSTALTLTLSRVLGRTDVAFGSTVAGRPTEVPGLDTVIGLFLNTVPVRTRLRPDETLRDLLRRTQDTRVSLMSFDHVGLAALQQDSGHPTLFDVLYVLQNFRTKDEEAAQAALHDVVGEGSLDHTHYPLALVVSPGDAITFRLEYRDDLIEHEIAEGFVARFRAVLDQLGSLLDAPVAAIDLTLPGDVPLDGPRHDLPDATVSNLLADRAALIPDADALVFEGTRLTYAELEAAVDTCAHVLADHGVGAESVVALAVPRTIETVVALFAILRAGGAYLPLELDHPDERLHAIIDDAHPVLILTHTAVAHRFTRLGLPTLLADALPAPADEHWDTPVVDPDWPAYVIYTSGSTGTPKGVVTPYRGLTNMQLNHREKVFEPAIAVARDAGITGRLRIAHTVSFAFDMSWEELLWLVEGHEVHICDEDLRRDSSALVAYCVAHRIDVINVTPTYAAQLFTDGLLDGAHVPPLVLLGGEAVGEPVWTALRENPKTFGYNLYGPTEYTINTLGIGTDESPTSSVGTPIWNTTAHLLDPWLRPVPTGVAGELYISGAGLARGYLGRADLTAERFVADPFGGGDRLYRTGDLMRVRPDGNLDFLGRTDDQVKVRGYRVELAEIDAALTALPQIASSAVVATADPGAPEIKRLVAYVIWSLDAPAADRDFAEIRRRLTERLPDYMVPTLFAAVDDFPMTVNGKLDVKALPAPERTTTRRAPTTELERRLCEIFADILGITPDAETDPDAAPMIGVDDDFFELGGHSMSAMRLVGALRTELGIDIAIRDLFEARTPAELATRAGDAGSASIGATDINPADRSLPIPLSSAQERLWVLYELDPADVSYHYGHLVRVHEDLDVDALRAALRDVLERHESLRTIVDDASGTPTQRVLPVGEIPDILEVGAVPSADAEQRAREFLTRTFDLRTQVSIRVQLTQITDDPDVARGGMIAIALHHIATDEWSDRPLLTDLTLAYAARILGEAPAFAPLPVQYADYAVWQRTRMATDGDAQLDHWDRELSGMPDQLTLPYDRPRRPGAPGPSSTISATVDAATRDRLARVAQAGAASMFMLVQAAVATLLYREGAGDDIPIGSPISGRTDPALDDLVGFFVGTQVLRADLSGRPRFDRLLERVRSADLAAFDNQDVDFAAIVERLAPQRVTGRNPLFQTAVSYLPLDATATHFLGARASFEPLTSIAAKFDLAVTVVDIADTGEMTVALEYADELFDPSTARALLDHLLQVLHSVATDPTVRVDRIDLIPADGIAALRAVEAGPAAVDDARTVTDLLDATAQAHPDAVAIRDTAGRALTYAEFAAASAYLATLVATQADPSPESVVAVVTERGIAQLAALCGVLHAGAAYLPIDADLPPDRITTILDDASVTAVIADSRTAITLADVPCPVIVLSDDDIVAWGTTPPTVPSHPPVRVHPDSPAYVVYTSGSTGRPKGVVISHRSAANILRWRLQTLPGGTLGDGDAVLVKTPAGFDGALWELLLPFISGATAVVAEPGAQRDPRRQTQVITEFGVTTTVFVPSLLEHMVAHLDATPTLRHIIAGGEALTADLASRVITASSADAARRVPLQLINAYGPTETTVVVTDHVETVDTAAGRAARGTGSVSIGRPVAGADLLVLDAALRRVPDGAVGELYVRGIGLARGYLARPGQTAASFVADPTGEHPGTRVYRTGDLVRRRGAELDYLGRADTQVKVRGNRVEIGEIESVIRALPGVRAAAAVVADDRVVAWVVRDPDTSDAAGASDGTVESLDAALREALPEYMVPTPLIPVDELPLNHTGKLDRRALVIPPAGAGAEGDAPPTTDLERTIVDAYAEALGRAVTDIHTSFFALGGHSLLAIKAINRLRTSTGHDVALRTLFDHPTVADLAAAITALGDAGPGIAIAASAPELVRRGDTAPVLSFGQERMLTLHGISGPSSTYNVPLLWRPADGSSIDLDALTAALTDVVDRHEILRTRYPADGPLVDRDQRVAIGVAEPGDLFAATTYAFDLATEIPVHARATDDAAVITIHHIATDEWSAAPLRADLDMAYAARLAGAAPTWDDLPLQYADFAAWQRAALTGARRDAHLDFWRTALAGTPEELDLPYDRARPARPSGRGDGVFVVLPDHLVAGMRNLSERTSTSMFMVVQAAVSALLARLGGGDDIPLGTPVTVRNDPRLDRLIGFFLNTVVLRSDVSGNPTAAQLLSRVRETDLAALDHRDIPFEQVVEEVSTQRSSALNPLFQTMVVYVDGQLPDVDIAAAAANPAALPAPTTAKFDLSFDFTEDARGAADRDGLPRVAGVIEYSTDLFDRGTIEAMATRLLALLEFMVAQPDTPLSALDIRIPAEHRAFFRPGPSPTSFPKLFDDAVAAHGDQPALRGADGSLTFRDLGDRVRGVASGLAAEGFGPEDVVAVSLPRSTTALIAIFGVLYSGAAYLPYDPRTPGDRVAAMREIAGVRRTIDSLDDPVLHHDPSPEPTFERTRPVLPEHPAYVIFTSGSTGTPKGVAIAHRGLANLFASHRRMLYGPAQERTGRRHLRVGHAWSLAFDASWQPQLWLLDGHEVSIVDDETQSDAQALAAQLRAEQWDFLELTPSHLAQLEGAEETMAAIGFGGEAVPDAQWQRLRLLTDSDAYNLYGPTEATVDALVARAGDTEHPVIGRPVDGAHAYVLDVHLRPVADGVDGELYLAGAGLARGYVGRGDLTSERFVADRFGPVGTRMYRTGDTVRWTREGYLEYRGRGDDQVKIRGYRVELGEVESALAADPGVREALVVARGGRLIGYVVGDRDTTDPQHLRRSVRDRLPDYMIPAAVEVLDAFPTLPNRKIDRRALPEPSFDTTIRPAQTPLQQQLCTAIADVLGVESDRVGLDEDFVELGGDSIVAMQLVARLRAEGFVVSPRDIMTRRTAGELAETVTRAPAAAALETVAVGAVPATPIVRWLENLVENPEQANGFHQSAFLVTPPGLDVDALDAALNVLIRRHHMLRARLVADTSPWRFEIPESAPAPRVTVESVGDLVDTETLDVAARTRSRLDPQRGAMVAATLLDRGTEPGRLLVAIHHLVVDGVSWRILVPELIAAYTQIADGVAPQQVSLAASTSDFGAWARRLVATSRRDEEALWHHVIGDEAAALSLLHGPLDPRRDRQGTARSHRVAVPAAATDRLLGPTPAALGVAVDDVLLGAFGVAAGRATLVDLEGHGRAEELVPGADLGGTIGWFTAVHPIRVGEQDTVSEAARALAAERAEIPDGGIGYGMMRYLDDVELPAAAIEFNYLGRYRAFEAGGWAMARESADVGPDDDMPAGHALVIDVAAIDTEEGTRLQATWTYQPGVIDEADVVALADRWVTALTAAADEPDVADAAGARR